MVENYSVPLHLSLLLGQVFLTNGLRSVLWFGGDIQGELERNCNGYKTNIALLFYIQLYILFLDAMFYSLYNAQGGVRSQMGVPRYRLPTNSRLMRKLHMALLLPQDALPFFLLFLSQFLSKWVRIVHVRVAVGESSQQLLSMVRARCAETPNLSWLLGCPLRLKGSAGVPYESRDEIGSPQPYRAP